MQRVPREPLAIVGIGCRFPGGIRNPAQLFELLSNKRSALSEVPADRWDAAAFYHPDFRKRGHIHVTRGGFLDEVDRFDAAFFGITPNEAKRMDPQQRLLLLTSYEALEDAGQPLERIAGSNTAVMIGLSSHDYDCIQGTPDDRSHIQGTTNTGSASSIAANRISYLFDLRGPSMAMDTACSSSLTAVHYACRALWEDGLDMALAGGANLILRPETTMGFSKGGFLAADAECRAFSDDASGYVRGEGVGMVLIKRLGAALRDGDPIYALIRGSHLNQDGRTFGMTLPSLGAQEAMLRAAYSDACVDPYAVCYVEAHGTGTPAGDPIEAKALGSVLGQGRRDGERLYLGSVKTNLGHLEPAAGIAGLIKLALCLKHRVVLPNRNFREPNPEIPFAALKLSVPTESIALPSSGPLFGGVNSFGFGGANAHVVMESPPAPQRQHRQTAVDNRAQLLVVSARTPTALKRAAGELANYLASSEAPLCSISATLATRRSAFEFRLAQVVSTKEAGADRLRRFAAGESDPMLAQGRVSGEKAKREVAFPA